MYDVYRRTEHVVTDKTKADKLPDKLWYDAEPGERWKFIEASAGVLKQQGIARSMMRLRCARLYSGRSIVGYVGGKWSRSDRQDLESRLAWNVCKAVTDTAQAIVAKGRPKALFLTEDGDYEQQERAKCLTKVCETLFEETQLYAEMQNAFRDCEIFDTGFVFFWEDEKAGTVRCERVFCEEVFVDDAEGLHGHPRELMRIKDVTLSSVLAMYPGDENEEKRKKIIQCATRPEARSGVTTVARTVTIYEAWRLPSSDGAGDGVRCLAINGTDLENEEWDRDYLPCLWLYWDRPILGFWGTGLVEELIGAQLEINRTLRCIQQAQELACVPRVYLDAASEIVQELDNEIGGHYRYTGRPPVISTGNAMPGEVYSHLETLYNKAFQTSGVSMQSATGMKPPGLNSGAAQREYKDTVTERFSLVEGMYQDGFMRAAKIMVDMMRRMSKDGAVKVKMMTSRKLRTMNWSEVDMSADEYVMRPHPISSLPSDAAGQLDFVGDLIDKQIITDRATALSLLDFQDVDSFVSMETAALDDAKMCVDLILNKGRMVVPDEYMNLDLTLKIAQSALLRARADERPQARVDMLLTYVQMVRKIIDDQAMAAPPGAPPAMPGQAMLPPGAGAMPMGPAGAPVTNGVLPPPTVPTGPMAPPGAGI